MHHDEGNFTLVGSGCGSVGRAVTSNTIGLHFESSHRQTLYITYILSAEKTKIRKNGYFLKNLSKWASTESILYKVIS